ncbi:AraC family transcriptional regulator [Flagellimonas taeanensis]|uniref:Transcriptional regulator, AraC family n=1 Tax=Flagellimonas taeanensis TaxID=1005926 RepID=A0A1M6RIU2_9FLAO|nr:MULTISPECIES: AraC family transcriptional regulator [Allomuricauda]MDC6386449.1 AraC family transcriptional regulator [Muricauda sp. SK9]MEE1963049.1 AraC family transcriptional regulator [Allomuricauda taeanensis]RIV52034.1 AraC family transcriptional regulator [Allomuricauda taeanensis]SFB75645.1 transcriptional regulator, AraC family [Allomuricauda taeanensis]SHK32350.1 transcriptional regulator, AraC family [Allomuricauda taeanensis]
MQLSEKFYKERKLEHLVENQTSYTLNNAAMHVFETHLQAERVMLQFDQPVLASMLIGKKVMHLRDKKAFDFLPGESLILPSNEVMCIDFPEADHENPTRCLAMAISEEKINKVITLMNEGMPKHDGSEWALMDYNYHFTNDASIYGIIQRLLYLFTENHPSKDFFVDNMLQELIIRILQGNARETYAENASRLSSNNRLAYALEYIAAHLHEPISVGDLSKKACMSESHFHKTFKDELGVTPIDYINNERIKLAVHLLQDPHRKIKEIYLECGFENRSYFNRLFKRKINSSPGEYQSKFVD